MRPTYPAERAAIAASEAAEKALRNKGIHDPALTDTVTSDIVRALSWQALHSSQGFYDFADLEEIADFIELDG